MSRTNISVECEGRSLGKAWRIATVCIGAMTFMACSKQPEPSEGEMEASSVAQATRRGALCEKIKSSVAEVTRIAITDINVMDDEGLPLRCVYNPSDPGPWFEIGDTPANLAEQRKGIDATGGKTHEIPELGPEAFGANRFGQHMVLGNKNDRRILVVGNQPFEQLQAMWQKVAEEI